MRHHWRATSTDQMHYIMIACDEMATVKSTINLQIFHHWFRQRWNILEHFHHVNASKYNHIRFVPIHISGKRINDGKILQRSHYTQACQLMLSNMWFTLMYGALICFTENTEPTETRTQKTRKGETGFQRTRRKPFYQRMSVNALDVPVDPTRVWLNANVRSPNILFQCTCFSIPNGWC